MLISCSLTIFAIYCSTSPLTSQKNTQETYVWRPQWFTSQIWKQTCQCRCSTYHGSRQKSHHHETGPNSFTWQIWEKEHHMPLPLRNWQENSISQYTPSDRVVGNPRYCLITLCSLSSRCGVYSLSSRLRRVALLQLMWYASHYLKVSARLLRCMN